MKTYVKDLRVFARQTTVSGTIIYTLNRTGDNNITLVSLNLLLQADITISMATLNKTAVLLLVVWVVEINILGFNTDLSLG